MPPEVVRVLGGGKRQVDHRERSFGVFEKCRDRPIVVVGWIDPEVGPRQPEFLGRALEPDIDAQVTDTRTDCRHCLVVACAGGIRLREQMTEGVVHPGTGHDAGAGDAVAVLHLHAGHRSLFHQDAPDARVGENLPPARLDPRDDRVGDAPGAAHRVETTVQIMPGNHRMHHEGRLAGRQPHVAPLTADDRDQVGVVGQLAQYLVGGPEHE